MKFICLGYANQASFAAMSPERMEELMNECFDYDDQLRRGGHFLGGEALQDAARSVTLRYRDGEVEATDGPYAETKEQLGGILILEADSLEHAVELMSKHPGVRMGPFEIRPANEEVNRLIAQRDQAIRE
ncbi:MAG: YciI family protein [Planctomycetales bacterium]|nr:YciI family protein [Planctomycetales bacterium]